MTNVRRLFAVLAVALLAAGGCGGDEGGDEAPRLAEARGEPEIGKLKVGALPITDLKQLFVADAKGFFREEGLEVEIQHLEGGAAIVPAVKSGSVDLGWSNSVSILQARARELGVRFFAGGLYQGPGHWPTSIVVPRDSPIRRPEQLRGRTVAINTLGNILDLVLRAYLDRAGVGPRAFKVVEVPFPEHPAALDAGRVDAIMPTEPFVTMATQNGARVLDPRPYTAIGSAAFVAAFFTTDDWLRKHPKTAAAFRRAVNKATRYWHDHPEEGAEIVARYTKVPRALAKRIQFGEPRTEISHRDVQRLIELADKYGLIPRTIAARDVLAR